MKKIGILFIFLLILTKTSGVFANTYEEGMELYEQKKYPEAIEKFYNSLKDGSANKEGVNLYLGNCYLKLGRNKEAIKEYEIAEKYKQNREFVYSNMAVMYYGNNDPENALIYCQKLLNENPNNTMHNWLMAQIYMSLNDNDKAKEYFNKAIEISGSNYMAYKGLGRISL